MPERPIRLRERLERSAARALAHLPPGWQVKLSGQPPVVVEGQALDPHVQLLRALRGRRNPHGLCEPTVQAGRVRFRRETLVFAGSKTPVGAVRDISIDGGLRVRHYAPVTDAPRPLTVYLHGGGFTIGDVDTHDEPCRILCAESRTHVLSVDYRLAPEHPFPAALDDTLAALRWARAHAAELGADAARVAIGGDSAGGNLAAVASLIARDEGAPVLAQLLVYPATDRQDPRRPSADQFGEGYFLSHADRAAFTRAYLDGTGVSPGDWRVAPLRAADLSRLPPALVVSAGFDMLRDEGEEYARALARAGSPVRLVRVPGHGHGFIHMTGVNPSSRAALVSIARQWGVMAEFAPALSRPDP
jgi:acetyl esterase